MIDASADPAAPAAKYYVIAETAGSRALTASALLYGTDTQYPTVAAGATVRQDLHLPAGMLSTSPASLPFEVSAAAPTASLPLTLSNNGGAAAAYEVVAIAGAFAGYAPTGPFAANTRHTGPKNLNDLDSSSLRIDLHAADMSRCWMAAPYPLPGRPG